MADKCCTNEELNKEKIVCPTCGNRVNDPKIMRCPRCFTSLIPKGCGACSGCGAKPACS